jgi:hypothetical protein
LRSGQKSIALGLRGRDLPIQQLDDLEFTQRHGFEMRRQGTSVAGA